jgi:Ca2+-binding EF-hand superfamily protein
MQAGNTSETQKTQESNSFLSILNLLDTNADGKIDTDELKFGAGFMINSLVNAQDQNGDQLLSAEEAGVSSSLVSQLDTDSDGKLSAGEMITPADKIIDGLVPILDTNGDGALSREELAVFELLFTGHSSMTSASGAYQSAVSGTDNSSDLLNNVSLKA